MCAFAAVSIRHLQADAYVVSNRFFTDPKRGLAEVGCWAHYLESAVIQGGCVEVVYGKLNGARRS
jgi:hypothetical protein